MRQFMRAPGEGDRPDLTAERQVRGGQVVGAVAGRGSARGGQLGMRTVSITWMTPLLAPMSVRVTRASLIRTPFEVEMSTVTGLHDLHAVFRGCPDRGIVLISGLEPHHAVFGRAIAQAAHRQRLVVSSLPPALGLPDMSPPEMTPPARARGARRYADFTIIGTMRIPPDAADARVPVLLSDNPYLTFARAAWRSRFRLLRVRMSWSSSLDSENMHRWS